MMYNRVFKRIIDFTLTLVGIVLISPLLLIIILCLLVVNRGKPFFVQSRPGKNEKAFSLIKFKTMNDKKDAAGNLLPDRDRITGFGAFLRQYSLDELPELINVLKGDMSLIGPRPLLFKYIPLYSEKQKRRHLVRPGITGLAQVSGRNSISWTQKFEYDLYYVENVALLMDMKILCRTFLKVVSRQGINQSSERPMLPFDGTN